MTGKVHKLDNGGAGGTPPGFPPGMDPVSIGEVLSPTTVIEGIVVAATTTTAGTTSSVSHLVVRLAFVTMVIGTAIGLVIDGFSIFTAVEIIVVAGLAAIGLLQRLGN